MATTGVQSHFSIMETFADLIPGIVLLAGIGMSRSTQVGRSLVPVSWMSVTGPIGVVELILFVTISFVVGMVVQTVGKAVEYTFDPTGQRAEVQIGKRKLLNPFGRVSMRHEFEALEKDRSTHFQEEFWRLCRDEFTYSDENGNGKEARHFLRYIRTYLTATPYSKNTHYHALSTMCRGLWAGFGILLLYYLLLIGLAQLIPGPSDGKAALGTYAAVSGVFMMAFGQMKNKFKQIWFDTLLFEYYLARSERQPN